MRVLLDTDVLIGYLQGAEDCRAVQATLAAEEGLLSAVCVFELFAGVRSAAHLQHRQELLNLVTVVPVTEVIALRAAALFTTLRARGKTIDNEDIFIAATALELKVPVMTRNKKHFEHVEELRIVGVAPPTI